MQCSNVLVQGFGEEPDRIEYVCWPDSLGGENNPPTANGVNNGTQFLSGDGSGTILLGGNDGDSLPVPVTLTAAPGWNGGAHSIDSVPPDWRGTVTFDLPDVDGAKQGGAAVGLVPVSQLPKVGRSGYTHLRYGLVVTSAYVRVVHAGMQLLELPYTDLRALREEGGTTDLVAALMYGDFVKWTFNGATLFAGGFTMPEPYALDATLFLAQDSVDNPKFTPGDWDTSAEDGSLNGSLPAYAMTIDMLVDSELVGTLPAYAARMSEGTAPLWDLVGSVPAYRMTAGDSDGIMGTLPAYAMVAADTANYGAVNGSLPAYSMVAGMEIADDSVPYSLMMGALPRYTMSMALADTATLQGSLPPYEMRASSTTTYSELRGSLPAYRMVAYSGEMTPLIQIVEAIGARLPVSQLVYVAITLIERVGGQVDAVGYATITAEAVERISAQDTATYTATLLESAMEMLGYGERVVVLTHRADGGLVDDGEAWVVNTRTQASTRYDTYGFNSFASVRGRNFGVRTDGIYLLEGDNDAGQPILSGVNLGQHDFGSQALKRVPAVHVGVSSAGNMFLKVIDGANNYTYRARRTDPRMKVQRFDVGRGLQANYFTFELTNEGDSFELDTVQFDVLVNQRRI